MKMCQRFNERSEEVVKMLRRYRQSDERKEVVIEVL